MSRRRRKGRSRKRNQRQRDFETANRSETYSSSYEKGQTVGYNYRKRGKYTDPVTTKHPTTCSVFKYKGCDCATV